MSSRPNFALAGEDPQHYGLQSSLTYVWDVGTLSWVKNTGGGGGGGAATIADGADVAQGTTSDVAWVSGAGTTIALLKTIASSGAAAGLTDAQLRAVAVPVSGTFFQGTQPVSAAALPLPAGASTSALQTQPGVDIGDVTLNNAAGVAAVNIQDGGNSLTVDGTVAVTSAGLTNLDVALSTRLKPADTLTAVTSITNPVSTKTDLTPAAPAAATVGVASAQAVAANASRKGLILVNVSNNRISLGLGNAAVLDSGITLYPGGVAEMDEYWFDLGAVNAIASAASSPLAIQELA